MRIPRIAGLLLLAMAACTSPEAQPATTTTTSATSVTTASPPPTEPIPTTIPILPHSTIDPSTMTGKLVMGYQGWFTCPGDGSGIDDYYHWGEGTDLMTADRYRMDMWPDTSELTEAELCPTAMTYPDGSPAYLYTTANPNTVLRHFQWMSEYGIDGVFLQRFGGQLLDPPSLRQRNLITPLVRDSAEAYGRVWAIMYDVTGSDDRSVDLVRTFIKDWQYLVDELRITESPAYLNHRGRPVVAIWGLGFDDRPGTPEEARELVAFFRDNPDPRYRATVVGGTPFAWRTLEPNARTDPAWADYYCSLDVISPWTVGAYQLLSDVDYWVPFMEADMARAAECGADYMPVVYPGHSYHNPDPSRPFNEFPRQGGRLYWHQVFRALEAGATMIYNAMFDEVDESTAMFKVAATSAQVPVGVEVVTMDVDGQCLPNDWYLTLAGEASRMLRGDVPLTAEIPVTPDGTEDCAFLPTARLHVATTSDWTTVTVEGASDLTARVVSSTIEAEEATFDGAELVLTQALGRAQDGHAVEMVVEVVVGRFDHPAITLTIRRGDIGTTTVTVLTYDGGEWTEQERMQWSGTTGDGTNLATFEVSAAGWGAAP